jgi:hypothetical protein
VSTLKAFQNLGEVFVVAVIAIDTRNITDSTEHRVSGEQPDNLDIINGQYRTEFIMTYPDSRTSNYARSRVFDIEDALHCGGFGVSRALLHHTVCRGGAPDDEDEDLMNTPQYRNMQSGKGGEYAP